MNNILSNPIIIVCIIAATSIVTLSIEKLIPTLAKKNDNIEKGIDTAKTIVNETGNIIEIADSVLPNNEVINVLEIIEKWAKKAVDCAEQLYKTSKLEKDERNNKAKEQIYSLLEMLNVKRTTEIDKIIDGTIEAEVFALGHSPTDIKQLQENQQQLKTENVKLLQENTQYKEAMSSVQTTVQALTQ